MVLVPTRTVEIFNVRLTHNDIAKEISFEAISGRYRLSTEKGKSHKMSKQETAPTSYVATFTINRYRIYH